MPGSPSAGTASVLRLVGLALVVGAALGTSCPAPSVHVFHRFPLARSPDSAFAAPRRVAFATYTFARPAPKRHWWSDEPQRPLCPRFDIYVLERAPDLPPDAEMFPPGSFEVLVTGGPDPHLVVYYNYHLPQRRRGPGTHTGRDHAARLAEFDTSLARAAARVAEDILRGSGAEPLVHRAETLRTGSWKELSEYCRRAGEGPLRKDAARNAPE